MVHVRTCPHAKSITIHTSSRSKNAEDLSRMIPAYFVMDGTISITAKVKIGNTLDRARFLIKFVFYSSLHLISIAAPPSRLKSLFLNHWSLLPICSLLPKLVWYVLVGTAPTVVIGILTYDRSMLCPTSTTRITTRNVTSV
jgi:hypothetical protein